MGSLVFLQHSEKDVLLVHGLPVHRLGQGDIRVIFQDNCHSEVTMIKEGWNESQVRNTGVTEYPVKRNEWTVIE